MIFICNGKSQRKKCHTKMCVGTCSDYIRDVEKEENEMIMFHLVYLFMILLWIVAPYTPSNHIQWKQ